MNQAGVRVRAGTETEEDLQVINEWRLAHRQVLNTFQATLRTRTKRSGIRGIVVAQRHKRKSTIFDKLMRFPQMQLARMDDVVGCRLIFENEEDLHTFRNAFHDAHFKHKLRNKKERYDYIKTPKPTGYRGIHDIYKYDVQSTKGQHLEGLFIEIQYRTKVQHAWATAVEVIGLITQSKPKFQKGDKRYEDAMIYASEILARAHEHRNGACPEMSDSDLLTMFQQLDAELKLLDALGALNSVDASLLDVENVILIFSDAGLRTEKFRYNGKALKKLFELEQNQPEADIVLVTAGKSQDIRTAFKNYFSDAKEFVDLLTRGCKTLSERT